MQDRIRKTNSYYQDPNYRRYEKKTRFELVEELPSRNDVTHSTAKVRKKKKKKDDHVNNFTIASLLKPDNPALWYRKIDSSNPKNRQEN